MGYYVQSYLTEASKIENVFGSKSLLLFETLAGEFKDRLEDLDDYFAADLGENISSKSVLLDIVYGAVRFPQVAFLYGYVYELLCGHFGEHVFPPNEEYSTNYYWQIPKKYKAFIPIPFSEDFPEIYSIHVNELPNEKKKFLQTAETVKISDENFDEERADFAFIFDKATAEKKDLVFFLY